VKPFGTRFQRLMHERLMYGPIVEPATLTGKRCFQLGRREAPAR
jgi:hypothetical protein